MDYSSDEEEKEQGLPSHGLCTVKMQIFEKDEANKVMLQKLRDKQVRFDDG